jgi:hypothetical protein
MKRLRRIAIWIYVIGALMMAGDILQTTYENGGFERSHSLNVWILAVLIYGASIALWPILLVWWLLVRLHILPAGPITLF